MRYIQINNISFTDVNGKRYAIKDIRPIPEYVKLKTIDITEKDAIDEIAEREYGSEDQGYKIYDMNIVKLLEVDFDLIRMKRIEVPV